MVVARGVFHLRNHRLASAGVAGDAVDRDRVIGRQKVRHDQRPQQRNGAGRPAAGIGNETCGSDLLALARLEFGKAISPIGCRPVRRGSVDHPCRFVALFGQQCHCLPARIVGQAQESDVCSVQQFGAQLRIAPLLLGNGEHLDIIACGKALAQLQPRRPVLAINEYLRFSAHRTSKKYSIFNSMQRNGESESICEAVESESEV